MGIKVLGRFEAAATDGFVADDTAIEVEGGKSLREKLSEFGGIVDVKQLPTKNINKQALYRVNSTELWYWQNDNVGWKRILSEDKINDITDSETFTLSGQAYLVYSRGQNLQYYAGEEHTIPELTSPIFGEKSHWILDSWEITDVNADIPLQIAKSTGEQRTFAPMVISSSSQASPDIQLIDYTITVKCKYKFDLVENVGSGTAIVDVRELPTRNIKSNKLYRVPTAESADFVHYGGINFVNDPDDLDVIIVDELPTENIQGYPDDIYKSIYGEGGEKYTIYLRKSDMTAWVYAPYMNHSIGAYSYRWEKCEDYFTADGDHWGGIVSSIKEATDNDNVYIVYKVHESVLYQYYGEKWQAVSGGNGDTQSENDARTRKIVDKKLASFSGGIDEDTLQRYLADYVKDGEEGWGTQNKPGILQFNPNKGIARANLSPTLEINPATIADIDKKNDTSYASRNFKPVCPGTLDYAVKVALTTNSIALTDDEKSYVRSWLGIGEGGGLTEREIDEKIENALTEASLSNSQHTEVFEMIETNVPLHLEMNMEAYLSNAGAVLLNGTAWGMLTDDVETLKTDVEALKNASGGESGGESGGNEPSTQSTPLKLYRISGEAYEMHFSEQGEGERFLFEAVVKNKDAWFDNILETLWGENVGLISFRVMKADDSTFYPIGLTKDNGGVYGFKDNAMHESNFSMGGSLWTRNITTTEISFEEQIEE